MIQLRPAIFLDRDGTLIKGPVIDGKPSAVRSVDEVQYTDGALQFCAAMRAAGLPLYLFTNQPDVARGLTTKAVVDAINAKVAVDLELSGMAVCWDTDKNAPGYKPNPGMLLQLADAHGLDLARSVAIGDRWRDVDAGHRAGTRTVFIDRDYSERHPSADLVVREIGEATPWVLAQMQPAAR
jgi:D-glycero-D-manno-heptose 1,7-bisphosphate phosphatase